MEWIFRFLVGGTLVSLFALLGDAFKPKTFAGLFGAAPSVALATMGWTIVKNGSAYAATECGAMIAGAAAFFLYACATSRLLARCRWSIVAISAVSLPFWLVCGLGLFALGNGR